MQLSYLPLAYPSESIRLLELQPATNFFEQLRCKLHYVSLLQGADPPCPPYKAISYSWNDDVFPESASLQPAVISCNGEEMEIPYNLLLCLRRVRSQISKPIMLWADSVCINQQDIEERDCQVLLIKEIFSRSDEVLVWLGETTPSSGEKAVCWKGDDADQALIDQYVQSFETACYPSVNGPSSRRGASISEVADYTGAFCLIRRLADGKPAEDSAFYEPRITEPQRIQWSRRVKRALWTIVERTWWKRTWIVQECVCANVATVMHGQMTAPWAMFAKAAEMHLSTRISYDTSTVHQSPLAALMANVLQIESPRASRIQGEFSQPIQLLRLFHGRHASDPRDKVFGLLGLMRDQLLVPSYKMTPAVVSCTVAANIISTTGRLDILAGRRPSAAARLPSWTVDWADPPPNQLEPQRLKSLTLYNASKGLSGSFDMHTDGKELILGAVGITVDEIEGVLPGIAPFETDSYTRFRATCSNWGAQVHADDIYWSSQFWRSLCGDIVHSAEHDNEPTFSRATSDNQRDFLDFLNDDTIKINRNTSYYGNIVFKYSPPSGRRNRFFYAMQMMTAGRKMFFTTSGRIGTGPATMKMGDKIVILAGSHTPLVLRPRSDILCECSQIRSLTSDTPDQASPLPCNSRHSSHEVIGDCYVAGIMDGEAVAEAFPEGYKQAQVSAGERGVEEPAKKFYLV